jgi:hypothetical protein
MSLGVFFALCIAGMDFLLYFLLRWLYGDKRAEIAKKVAAERRAMALDQARPFVVYSRRGGVVTQKRIRKIRQRMGRSAVPEKRLA